MESYGNTTAIGLAQGGGNGSATAPQQPLLMDVMERTRRHRDSAYEIRGRLMELRDRLFGTRPETGAGSAIAKASQDCFADSFDETSLQLQSALYDIDRISAEIANRL